MIRMVKGTYGLKVGGIVEAKTKHSEPFTLPESREAELVAAGVAEYVDVPTPKGKSKKREAVKAPEETPVPETAGEV